LSYDLFNKSIFVVIFTLLNPRSGMWSII